MIFIIFSALFLPNIDKKHDINCRVGDYDCLESYFDNYSNSHSPKSAINRLYEVKKIKDYSQYCHTLAHFLGKKYYNLYNSPMKALNLGGKSCSDGYYHGVIEEYARQIDSDTYTKQINDICASILDKYLNMDCIHGIGHGSYIIAKRNPVVASKICNNLASDFNILMCTSGVFMQFSLDERLRPNTLDNLLNICDKDISTKYREACLNNIFLKISIKDFDGDFSHLRVLCDQLTQTQRVSCYYGIGYAGSGLIEFDPSKYPSVCGTKEDEASLKCVYRLSQGYGAVYSRKLMINKICPLFRNKQRDYCLSVEEVKLR